MALHKVRVPFFLRIERANQITRPMSAPQTLHNSYAFAVLLLNLSIYALDGLRSSDLLNVDAVDSGPCRRPFLPCFGSHFDL